MIRRSGMCSEPRVRAARMSGTPSETIPSSASVSSICVACCSSGLTTSTRAPATIRPRSAAMVKAPFARAPDGLVVVHFRAGRPAHREPVADRRRRVVQVLGLHQHLADSKKPLLELGEVDTRAEIPELHGEVRILHLPRHG